VSAPRKLFQIAVVPKADGAVIYARRDDGRLFRYFDVFDRRPGEWVEIPLPPNCKAWTGDNSNFSGGEY
jgi:hypothetical protein